MNAEQLLVTARARESARAAAAPPRTDYAAANKKFRQQKAALTRAINKGDRDKLVVVCATAVREWGQAPFNGAWPDDWSRWQRALDDAFGGFGGPRLEDLQ